MKVTRQTPIECATMTEKKLTITQKLIGPVVKAVAMTVVRIAMVSNSLFNSFSDLGRPFKES